MAGDNSEDKKGWLQRLNDGASLIAAVIGIIIALQTMRLNNEIDQLNENIEASTLISDLIGSLTSEDVKQDIALLALDNALTSDPEETDVARGNRHKKLVAEIAASLLNNQPSSVAEGEDVAALSRQIQEESNTARRILERLANESNQDSEGPEYQQIAKKALEQYRSSLSSPTGRIQAQINSDESASSSADDVVVPEVTIEDEAALTPQQKEQQTLELATAAGAVSAIAGEEDSDQIIYLHYDNPDLRESMQTLKTTLEEQDWFVIDNIQLVSPDEFNCSVNSDIRFFHQEDLELAQALREAVAEAPSADLQPSVAQIRLIDLSNWSQANLVPKQQLELWLITKGNECQENRAS